jgi:hypothetical protein
VVLTTLMKSDETPLELVFASSLMNCPITTFIMAWATPAATAATRETASKAYRAGVPKEKIRYGVTVSSCVWATCIAWSCWRVYKECFESRRFIVLGSCLPSRER